MGLLWAGYAVTSWGFVLVKGWDITFREWVSPLHPYQWPASGNPPKIPQGKVWPVATGTVAAAGPQTEADLQQAVTPGAA